MKTLRLTAALCVVFACPGAQNPLIGTWKLNPAKSKNSDRRSSIFIYQPAGSDGYRFITDTVGTDGVRRHVTGLVHFDGKDYPVQGSDRAGATVAVRRVGNRSVELVRKSKGNIVDRVLETVSEDGKVLTWTSGESIMVYDRQ